jgi:hypothetical protein
MNGRNGQQQNYNIIGAVQWIRQLSPAQKAGFLNEKYGKRYNI